MPINPNLKRHVKDDKKIGGGRPKYDRDYTQYNNSPSSQKVGRERIFDTDGFKKAIEEVSKNFGHKVGKPKDKK